MTKLTKTALVAVLTALASGAAGIAGASEMRVSVAGKSTDQIHAEIVKAASSVCWADVRGEALAAYVYPECVRRSVDNAVAQLGDVKLAAYHKANPGAVRLAAR